MSRIASGLFSACFLVLCLLSCQASASDALPTDSNYYLYKTITKADGLSQLSVFDIKKDQDGFYWLATAGGLYRFDGLKLKKFEFGNDESDESASHFARCIQLDNQGGLWVGTQRGLLYKEPHKNAVTAIPAFAGQIIWSVFVYNENELLISTQDSLWRYDYVTQQKKKLSSFGKIKSVVQSHDTLILGTFSEGLVSLDMSSYAKKKVSSFGIKINKIKAFNDHIYIASSTGLYKVDDSLDASPALASGNVNDFIVQQDDIILARDNGIYSIKGNAEYQISTGKIWSLIINDSLLIAGTHTDGLKEYQRSPQALSNINLPPSQQLTYVADIGVLDKSIYFTDNLRHLYEYNRQDKKTTLLNNLKASSIFSSNETLLISDENSINIINKDKGVTVVNHKNKVLEADHDQYWYILDENNNLYKIDNDKLIFLKSLSTCNFGYPNLLKIRTNDIFVGGDAGLCKFVLNSPFFKKISDQWTKSELTINDTPIFLNKKGQGVDENGTIRFDLNLERGEDAYSFAEVRIDNHLYIISSTSKGIRIYKYVNAKPTLLDIFDSRYRILSEYVAGSVSTTTSGLAFFGGVGGISAIDVSKLNEQNYSGNILTSGIKIYNEPKPALQEQFAEKKSITLESYQYPLSVAVSLLDYPFPGRAKLQYRLSSYGDNWYNFDGSSSITLSRLDSGLYEINFRALDKSKVIATSPQYSINILPPWWRSNMAFFLYSLFILGVIIHVMSIINNRRQQHVKLIESEERLKLALWGSGDELWDWDIKSGNIYRSNIWNDFLLPEDGFRSKDNQSNIYPKDLERVKSTLQACLSGEKEEFEVAYRVHDKTMNWVWVLDRGRVVEHDDNGLPGRMTGTLKNISHLKKTEEMLKLLATSFKNISDAICIVDQDFVILDINDSFTTITGQSREEAVGQTWNFSLYNDSFIEQVKQTLDRAGRWHDEIEAKRKNGVIYPIEITIDKVFDEEKDSYNFVAVFSDISERKEKEKELERLTNTDTLTGLPNRSFFMSTLDRQVRKGQHFALLLLDLNNFKQINDSLGHQLGDLLLIEVAERLQKVMQSNHTLYRLGGDEFAVIIDSFNKLDDLTRLSAELHQQLLTPFNLLGEELTMSCAIGAVLYPDDGLSPEHLLRNADAAMYHAKHEGSETCQFFSSSMNEQASARLAIENRIRKALREDLFSVYYQPKVETLTGRCTGAEALLRLPDGKGGFISPVEFIPIAEESGLILDVGNWVLEASCKQVKVWHEQGIFPGRIAINLSARQFRHSDLVAQIDKVLAETQLPAHVLEMEITESTMMEDPIRAIAVMERLRSRNITLAMDDFGTGYSSLSNLRQFPVTSVKIDRAFVKDLTSDQGAKNLTGAIISLADSLALHVVAEGVETAEQLAILKDLNCPTCQGFLFGRPVPAREFEELVTRNGGMLGPENTIN
ncbi:EAL domain-containing protein [Gallaecimonas pentaromativorans]|uniref:PAS domain S-box-containing protein/diguanylate cyclase (GGDEF)-like protein n=1 Tax=Gallaecimonas pentaromativorans TaxID=584787 RepID=A0A3N1PSZ2_9GAMM|nr:EAL domain-containing protein [Gallaecimonas pentaromativorans]ROQ29897.1 PAS domain S-box-containing protein/diguanylate cyclase (GGDEF)-like protein [Gallaecimonas pentaromativorans]